MANIFEYNGFKPVIDESAFIHPNANIIGNVIIGKEVYVGPCASVRGDFGQIVIKDGANVQDNCTIHMFPGVTTVLNEGAHIGHGAVIHGGQIGKNSLIGMNAVIMDNVEIGEGCIVGALTLVTTKTVVPPRKVVVGNPGKVVNDVTDEMLKWKTQGTAIYGQLSANCHETLKSCEPLREVEPNRPDQDAFFKTWKESQPSE